MTKSNTVSTEFSKNSLSVRTRPILLVAMVEAMSCILGELCKYLITTGTTVKKIIDKGMIEDISTGLENPNFIRNPSSSFYFFNFLGGIFGHFSSSLSSLSVRLELGMEEIRLSMEYDYKSVLCCHCKLEIVQVVSRCSQEIDISVIIA
ncbi:hypothetical protein CEXT_630971 [Caerostris extrusa]|uniref:Uncharacterized protein n=1 Tax=Caerostris extrusa TaxID=172846 RepID=A0AAV4RZD2_CAEEX|nr:hypothetical protein CEXT_630971 [Caerostris extrusa]